MSTYYFQLIYEIRDKEQQLHLQSELRKKGMEEIRIADGNTILPVFIGRGKAINKGRLGRSVIRHVQTIFRQLCIEGEVYVLVSEELLWEECEVNRICES